MFLKTSFLNLKVVRFRRSKNSLRICFGSYFLTLKFFLTQKLLGSISAVSRVRAHFPEQRLVIEPKKLFNLDALKTHWGYVLETVLLGEKLETKTNETESSPY